MIYRSYSFYHRFESLLGAFVHFSIHLYTVTMSIILRTHSDRMCCDFSVANNRIENYACVRNRKTLNELRQN